MWDLIVSVPDHCLSFYFSSRIITENFYNICSRIFFFLTFSSFATKFSDRK